MGFKLQIIYRREETKYNRSAWCRGKRWNLNTEIGGSSPAVALSFSDVDIGVLSIHIEI